MLHDIALHDVIGGHQVYIHRFMGHRIILAKTTSGSHDARALRARRDHKLASRERVISVSGHVTHPLRGLKSSCRSLVVKCPAK